MHIECPPGYRLDDSQVCLCEQRVEVLGCDDINMEFVLLDVSDDCYRRDRLIGAYSY